MPMLTTSQLPIKIKIKKLLRSLEVDIYETSQHKPTLIRLPQSLNTRIDLPSVLVYGRSINQ